MSGNSYYGEWKDDCRTGCGVFSWEDGEVYEGKFENDTRTGVGVHYYLNGDRYEGLGLRRGGIGGG